MTNTGQNDPALSLLLKDWVPAPDRHKVLLLS